MSEGKKLSEREEQILQLVATGMTNREIAQQLTISPNTVKVHLSNVFEKIGVASRTEATLYAIEHGVVDIPGNENPTGVEAPESEKIWKKVLPFGILAAVLVLILLGFLIFGTDLIFPNATPTAESMQSLVETEERWVVLAPLPEPRAGLAATAYDGDIYAIAGEGLEGVSGSVFRYVANDDRWEVLSDKPTPVRDVKAVLIGEKIYIPGGMLANGLPSDVLEIYDPREDTWEKGSALPQAISAYALADFEGQLYLFGGWNGERALDSVYIYDPDENTWREGTPMPTARFDAGAGEAGGKIFVIGGWDGERALTVNEVYFPERDSQGESAWSAQAELPEPLYACAVESIGEIIFLLSPAGEQESQGNQFLPQRNEWQIAIENAPIDLQHYSGSAKLQGYLYVLGGEDPEGEIFDFTLRYQAIFMLMFPNVVN